MHRLARRKEQGLYIMEQGISYSGPLPADVLHFQLKRVITSLFKSHLTLVEELGDQHDESLGKLRTALPESYRAYVDLADYLTPERGAALRKRILDTGNDNWREVEKLLSQFHVEFK